MNPNCYKVFLGRHFVAIFPTETAAQNFIGMYTAVCCANHPDWPAPNFRYDPAYIEGVDFSATLEVAHKNTH
jgi:hypothetical protein